MVAIRTRRLLALSGLGRSRPYWALEVAGTGLLEGSHRFRLRVGLPHLSPIGLLHVILPCCQSKCRCSPCYPTSTIRRQMMVGGHLTLKHRCVFFAPQTECACHGIPRCQLLRCSVARFALRP